jgi:hypothetical protein
MDTIPYLSERYNEFAEGNERSEEEDAIWFILYNADLLPRVIATHRSRIV